MKRGVFFNWFAAPALTVSDILITVLAGTPVWLVAFLWAVLSVYIPSPLQFLRRT